MIQFNLLPDVKVQYLRANRQKHFVVLGSVIVIIASAVALVVLLSVVFGLQKKNISDLSKDIRSASVELQATPELTKILTVQNQLASLTQLHNDKPVVTRLFDYLQQSTPADAQDSRIVSDFVQHTMIISGSSKSLATVNTYIDALKAATYHTAEKPKEEKPAFSDVVLAAYGRDEANATYTITLNFQPDIFSELNDVTFSIGTVPKNGAGQ